MCGFCNVWARARACVCVSLCVWFLICECVCVFCNMLTCTSVDAEVVVTEKKERVGGNIETSKHRNLRANTLRK